MKRPVPPPLPDDIDPDEFQRVRKQIVGRATRIVDQAIRSKKLIPPKFCEFCGAGPRPNIGIGWGITPAQNYDPPYFNIKWLCRTCHTIWDREVPKTRDITIRTIRAMRASTQVSQD